MKKIFIFLLFITPLLLNAQKESKLAEIFCAVDEKDPGSVHVKWLYKTVYHPDGFDVFRQKTGTTDWVKINQEAVKPLQVLPASNKLDNEAKDLHKAMINTSYEEFSKNIIRAFVLIKAIYVNELAEYIGISIVDKSAEQGKEYVYKVCIAGKNEQIGISNPIMLNGYKRPAPPEDIKITRTKKRVDISWKPDIYRYYSVDIYRRTSDDTTYRKITKPPRAIQKDQADKYNETSIFYQDTAIEYNSNYFYRFVAIDYFGNSSAYSTEYSSPSGDFIPPSAPFDLLPTSSSLKASVRLDWKIVDEKDLAGIYVYWSNSPDKKYERLNKELIPKTNLSYTHTNAPVGSNYYKVATADIAGNETYSTPVFVEIRDVIAPSKPSGLVSESGEGFIKLSWKANSEPDLLGYHVQRSLKINSQVSKGYINVTQDPIKETTYTETLPKNVKNEFVYRIVAVDTTLNRSLPSENTLAKMPDVTPPLQPFIKGISSDTGKAVVTWMPNKDPDLEGYDLYKMIDNDSNTIVKVNINLIPAKLSTYTDRDVVPGKEYSFMLEAIDSSGNRSLRSSAFSCRIKDRNVAGTVRIDSKNFNSKKKVLKLEWSTNISEEVKGYVVYCRNGKDLPFKPMTGLITENKSEITLGDYPDAAFYIKCYTVSGRSIQSETFDTGVNEK